MDPRGHNIKDVISSWTAENVAEVFDTVTYSKGRSYYENDSVNQIGFNAEGTVLSAFVHGQRLYEVTLEMRSGRLHNRCSCPISANCKHVCATLLYAVLEEADSEVSRAAGSPFLKHLQSLSKEDLISLVLEFAPERFVTEVTNKESGGNRAEKAFAKVKKAVDRLFQDSEALYDPDDFESALAHHVSQLFGFEQYLRSEIAEFILHTIRRIEDATDEGYLYNNYYDDPFEVPDEFSKLTRNLLISLDAEERKDFLMRLDELITGSSYGTFENFLEFTGEIYSAEELPELRQTLLKDYQSMSPQLVVKYYDMVESLLDVGEKETILLTLKGRYRERLLELAQLYESLGKNIEADKLVNNWLKTTPGFGKEEVYVWYIDFAKRQKKGLDPVLTNAITDCPTGAMMEKIAAVAEKTLDKYELLLENKSPESLFDYLEETNRLSEALALSSRSKRIGDQRLHHFFKRHKKSFPLEATKFFENWITCNLEFTGDHYYESIADTLKHLRSVNADNARRYVHDIKTNYKRRRNLMSLIDALG